MRKVLPRGDLLMVGQGAGVRVERDCGALLRVVPVHDVAGGVGGCRAADGRGGCGAAGVCVVVCLRGIFLRLKITGLKSVIGLITERDRPPVRPRERRSTRRHPPANKESSCLSDQRRFKGADSPLPWAAC